MKLNKNIFWTKFFVEHLVKAGVKYACIAPGSRSTPLTYSFVKNKKIKCFTGIDERSLAFFALGLSKKSKTPVAIVCTSGTAVANIYPAVIEAFYSRVPLIVCSADRPAYLVGKGANQTINQKDFYKNHVRAFLDCGLPKVNEKSFSNFSNKIISILNISISKNIGPVHFNFPFEKPFEPEDYTDEVSSSVLNKIKKISIVDINFYKQKESTSVLVEKLLPKFLSAKKGLIVAGPSYDLPDNRSAILNLAKELAYPVFADVNSGLRHNKYDKHNVIDNYDILLRKKKFVKNFKPDLLLHFGRLPVSKGLEDYYSKFKGEIIFINEFGDVFDPTGKGRQLIIAKVDQFCNELTFKLKGIKFLPNRQWLDEIKNKEEVSKNSVENILQFDNVENEIFLIKLITDLLPLRCQLMLSNSLPIRDFDTFSGKSNKDIRIFCNRGASGIDGIISTAIGIASDSDCPTILITGDLAFLHDLNSLITIRRKKVHLIIIVFNNKGGGLFNLLPISKYKDVFSKYFLTQHNLKLKELVLGFKVSAETIENSNDFRVSFIKAIKEKKLSIIEIETNSKLSLKEKVKIFN